MTDRRRPLQRPRDCEITLSPKDYLPLLLLSLVLSLIVVSRVVRLTHFRLFVFDPPPFHILACLVGPVTSLFRHPTCLTTLSEGRLRLSRSLRAHLSPLALAHPSRQPSSLSVMCAHPAASRLGHPPHFSTRQALPGLPHTPDRSVVS